MPENVVPVGMVALEGTRAKGAGSMFDRRLIPGPVSSSEVPGATTASIVSAPKELADAYATVAQALADDGAQMVISNCGISMAVQSAVVARTGLPTVMSSLLLLPVLVRVFGGSVGVLTYDAPAMYEPGLRAECGWVDGMDVAVAGVRHLRSWRSLEMSEAGMLPIDGMRSDLIELVREFVAGRGLSCLLIECTAMLPFRDEVRAASNTPVFDIFSIIGLIRKEI